MLNVPRLPAVAAIWIFFTLVFHVYFKLHVFAVCASIWIAAIISCRAEVTNMWPAKELLAARENFGETSRPTLELSFSSSNLCDAMSKAEPLI